MKIFSWLVSAVLVLVVAALGFIYFSPGYSLLLVRSESMRPAINMGDLIVTVPVNGPINGEVKPGTIVTYQLSQESVTHRVLSVDGETIVTKGDAAEDPDSWPVTLSDVVGIYLFKIPYIGYVTSFVQTKFGWFLAIIIPVALIVAWLVKDILKEAFSDANKNNSGSREVKLMVKQDES